MADLTKGWVLLPGPKYVSGGRGAVWQVPPATFKLDPRVGVLAWARIGWLSVFIGRFQIESHEIPPAGAILSLPDVAPLLRLEFRPVSYLRPSVIYLWRNMIIPAKQVQSAGQVVEALQIVTPNTVPSLGTVPASIDSVLLEVNGVSYSPLGSRPAFTVVGQQVTWNPLDAGFELDASDLVIARYFA